MPTFAQTETPDPRFPLITHEQALELLDACNGDQEAAAAELSTVHERRETGIRMAKEDPLRYGYEPETFALARELLGRCDEVLLSGAQREGKTECAAKVVMEELTGNEPAS